MLINGHQVVVRWMRGTDVAKTVELFKACYPEQQWTVKDLSDFAVKEAPHKNVAKVIAGGPGKTTVFGALLYSIDHDDCVRFRRLAVRHDLRRRGLASFALQTVIGPKSLFRGPRRFVAGLTNNKTPIMTRFFFTKHGFVDRGAWLVFDKSAH